MDDLEERKKIYSEYRDHLLKLRFSNSENLDKAILSLSTAGLGFSLVFIKDVVPLEKVGYICLLHLSWYSFAFTIVTTLFSFIVGKWAIDKQLDFAEKYYLERKEEFLNKTNWPNKITVIINFFSVSLFIGAVFLTIVFVSLNTTGGREMAEQKKVQQAPLKEVGSVTQTQKVQEAVSAPKMQKLQTGDTLKKGVTVPTMQPVTRPRDTSKPGDSNQGGSGDQSSSGSGSSSGETGKK
jgi:hypothetical protein